MSDSKKILSVKEVESKYGYCNTCRMKVRNGETGTLDKDNRVHEIQFGKYGQSVSVRLCTKCLLEFSDKLWEYISENI